MTKCTTKSVVLTKSTATVEAMYASAVGIDVHADLLVCCYQAFNTTSGETISDHASFGTKQSDLSSFSAWVRERNPEIVLMESTGILWLSAYEALENVGFTNEQLALVNARDVKAVKGRKTDRADAERLTQIARFGCFKKSFVPAKVFREMRAISRLYIKSQNDLSRAQNRLHKLLNATGCRARQVFSDLKGVAATFILEAWLDEVEDFESVVRTKGRRLRASPEEIMDALNFSTSDCLRQTIRLQRENIARLKQFCVNLLEQLKVMQRPYENIISALTTIPGIKETSARLLLAEFSDSMDSFPDSEHFASWLGICPGNNISAGKEHGSGAPKGNKWARTTLTEIAGGISLMKNNPLKDRFQLFKERRGTKRAIVAIAHKVAVIIYSMIKNGEAFRAHDYSEAIRDHRLKRLGREIRRTQHQNLLLTEAGIVDAASGTVEIPLRTLVL